MSGQGGRNATGRMAAVGACLLAACASAPPTAPTSSRPAAPEAQAPATAGAPVTLTAAEVPVPVPGLRLPTDVRPTSERISLRLDPRAKTYTGTVRIPLAVSAPVTAFWLYAQDLTIRRAAVAQGGGERAARIATAPPDLLAIVPASPLAPGQAELVLDFQGTLDAERSRGLYKVAEGDTPYLYTFFEPVDARRAFPCFDEPSFKIPWELEIVVPPGNGAFANAAEAGRQTGPDGWVTVRFERTRPLPSYLVAFAAGPFDVVPGPPAGNHQTRAALHRPARPPRGARLRPEPPPPQRGPPRGRHRPPLSVRKARRAGRSPLLGDDGAPRPGRARPAADAPPTAGRVARPRAAGREHHHPRAGPLLVRRSGHPRLVGRHLAQRVLRQLDRRQGHRPARAGVALEPAVDRTSEPGDAGGLTPQRQEHPSADSLPGGHRGVLRCGAHLLQGPDGHRNVRAVGR